MGRSVEDYLVRLREAWTQRDERVNRLGEAITKTLRHVEDHEKKCQRLGHELGQTDILRPHARSRLRLSFNRPPRDVRHRGSLGPRWYVDGRIGGATPGTLWVG